MEKRFDYGDEVRLIRNVRNDGTFPGMDVGALMMRRGSVGCVVNVGTFLQDQIIYTVHFLGDTPGSDMQVGCREEELIPADDPWVQNSFEFRDKVTPRLPLSIKGEVIAAPGDEGEIEKLIRDMPDGIHYHARFSGRTVLVPETALDLVSRCGTDHDAARG